VIRARYEKQWVKAAQPVLDYYRGKGLVDDVDASRTPDEVAREVDGLLDGLEAA